MRFKRHMELEHGLKQIDIAPLVNIIFLLLIFIMFSSSFVIQPGIRVNLPKAVTSESVRYANIEILIDSQNLIYLNGKTVSRDELNTLFKQAFGRNQAVLIKADKRAYLGKTVEIWDMARNAGITQVNIATNQE